MSVPVQVLDDNLAHNPRGSDTPVSRLSTESYTSRAMISIPDLAPRDDLWMLRRGLELYYHIKTSTSFVGDQSHELLQVNYASIPMQPNDLNNFIYFQHLVYIQTPGQFWRISFWFRLRSAIGRQVSGKQLARFWVELNVSSRFSSSAPILVCRRQPGGFLFFRTPSIYDSTLCGHVFYIKIPTIWKSGWRRAGPQE